MIVNVNGTIEAISQPRKFETNGRQGYSMSVVMKHDFRANQPESTNPNTYLGYITFDVISTQDRPLWKQMNLQIGEDIEVSLNIDVQVVTNQDGSTRWFNRITAFKCERDSSKWHRQTEIRKASGTFPGNAQPVQQQATQQQPTQAAQPVQQPATIVPQGTVAPWGNANNSDFPF